MTTDYIIYICREMLTSGIYILLPVLGTALIVGVAISVFQAVTQINEMTLAFGVKIGVVGGVIFVLLPWYIDVLMSFTIEIFRQISVITH